MRMDKLNKALDHIDSDLIDEFVRESESLQRKKAVRRDLLRIIPVAACLVILVGVSSAHLGYKYGKLSNFEGDIQENMSGQLQIVLEKEGRFVFEYKGKLYQAYVSPALNDDLDLILGESVSIQQVGERLSNVKVTDEKGNVATLEIYSSKGVSNDEMLLKLDCGYFPVSQVE